jgi:hypothetical protein
MLAGPGQRGTADQDKAPIKGRWVAPLSDGQGFGWIAGSTSLCQENIRQVGRPAKAQDIFAADHCPEGFR